MVRLGRHIVALMLVACPLAAVAQVFPVTDTVSEYRHKGTFYHDRFEGRKTASGEIFDQNGFTAAHWKIKLGTYVLVTNQNTGLQVIVKVNDRCPKHGVLDLSHRAATAIGIRGCQPVTVRLLPSGYEDRCLAQDAIFDSVYSRLNPAPPAAEEQKETVEQKEPAAPKQIATPHKHVPTDDCYRLILCTVENHAESFAKIQLLPQHYRDKVLVETLDDGGLQLALELTLNFAQADELCRALKRKFPEARLAACP